MSGMVNSTAALKALNITQDAQASKVVAMAGIMPKEIGTASVVAEHWVTGMTCDDFMEQYSSQAFDYDDLKTKFKEYCKDFNEPLADGKPSKALEFSAKVLFELGPLMRLEKKGKGDKAVRICFPYIATNQKDSSEALRVKTIIITTFKDMSRPSLICDDKLILTMKQATLLAMETFNEMCIKAYNDTTDILMTPLCGAVFGKDCVKKIASALGKAESEVTCMLNSSTSPNGHYLDESNISCAIVAMIASTKGVSSKNIRDQMITKVIKQYSAMNHKYDPTEFTVMAEFALGGVPPGLDSGSLIENFQNIQISARVRRSTATYKTTATATPDARPGASKDVKGPKTG